MEMVLLDFLTLTIILMVAAIISLIPLLFQGSNINNTDIRNIFVEMSNYFGNMVMGFRDINYLDDDDLKLVSYDICYSNNKYILTGNRNDEVNNIDYYAESLYFQLETSGHNSYCLPNVECSLSDIDVKSTYLGSEVVSMGHVANLKLIPVYRTYPYNFFIDCSYNDSDGE